MNNIRQIINSVMYKHGISWKSIILRLNEKKLDFQDYISIVCIAKNEGLYIKEWIDYHLMIGVDRIYIYDNDSPDNMKEVLQPYIESGKIVYTFYPGIARQLDAYNDAISKYKMKTKYMAFIDVDEFLVLEDASDDLSNVIDSIMRKNWRSGGIAVNWRMFGSSGHISKPHGFVIENYLYRGGIESKGSECIKTIANPRYIRIYQHPHAPVYVTGFNNIDEDGNLVLSWHNALRETKKLRINHYFTKSEEEWIERRSKRKADSRDETDLRTMEEFYEHDHNDIYDGIMLQYVEKMRRND